MVSEESAGSKAGAPCQDTETQMISSWWLEGRAEEQNQTGKGSENRYSTQSHASRPTLIHPEACCTNIKGMSQANQVDSAA